MLEAISAAEIAVSGLKAQRARMDVIANNIANMQTTRTAKGGPFRRQVAIFRGETIGPHFQSGHANPSKVGVHVDRIVGDPSPFRMSYEPGHPDADAEGYVAYPNVDLSVEMVNLVAAQRAYDANVAVVMSDKRMKASALKIIEV